MFLDFVQPLWTCQHLDKSVKFQVLYNAQLLDWQPGHTSADVWFFDYGNVERVELRDMYITYR